MVSARMAAPRYSKIDAGAAADADARDQRQDDVLGGDAGAQRAIHLHLGTFSICAAAGIGVASTCSTSLVPMPKASAPNAPCVAVWLSPQTTVMPGCVRPSSGPITCTMPCRSLCTPVAADAEIAAVGFQLRDLLGGDRVDDGQRAVGGGDAVVGGGDGQIGAADFEAALAQALKGLRRGDFVDQVQVDVEQGGRAGLFVDHVRVPEFFDNGAWGHRVKPMMHRCWVLGRNTAITITYHRSGRPGSR